MGSERRKKLTYADWLELPEYKGRMELIDGRLVVSASPLYQHQIVISTVVQRIMDWLRVHPVGLVVSSPHDVRLDELHVVQPDIVYCHLETVRRRKRGDPGALPELVIEVLSKTTASKDRHERRARYERYGILEYWMVDWRRRTVEVHQLESGLYRLPVIFREADPIRSLVLTGLDYPVADFFSDLDVFERL